MTDKLEKKFFDTFKIEPTELISKTMNCACGCHDCKNCDKYKNNSSKKYPQITDYILLELIVIISSKIPFLGRAMYMEHRYRNIEDLKVTVLNMLIEYKVQYEHQVRALFGGNNDR